MTIVALETSSRPPSIAVRSAERTLALTLEEGRRHASDLLGTLESLLAELDESASSIKVVIVGTGPGSYTGLRVGIATALGLTRGSGAKLQALPSFEALALAHLKEGECGTVLLDARSRQLYGARYERTAEGVRTLLAPMVCDASDWRAALPATDCIVCDEASANAAELSEDERALLRTCTGPRAQHLLPLGIARLEATGPLNPAEVQPLYLRPFAANVRKR
ncbi:MAG TPA: tRNA (adenosine(37)-N6)-threonylcarbamoyltransferase complex dimerization subunit type 1 TsaB [Planctomycetes bacterium]|nr:tRNA (adenosine(37)-N6)-threonylcarbamoyltransferase complex dimerization subunit type 1 TsaB [Planctomycetota bacterium]HIK60141.1 tRNA (adenosine(37)-N6)-threonylcarbamoyltransferase complex dimerization subunit type 1 TsaB [Planctomycetota bacterium]